MPKPIWKYKAGQVSGALWENEIAVNGKVMTVLKASVQRRFKDKDGQWKSSASFNRNEIPMAIHCLQKCFERIIELQQNESNIEEEMVA
ncbi:hypothetical protein ACFL6U_25375 [Planctomycetota bacterium]